jgi:hypothetical protein
MPTRNEENKRSGDPENPMANYNPTDRNFQRNEIESDVSETENSQGGSDEEKLHTTEKPKGSSGPEEKDITD